MNNTDLLAALKNRQSNKLMAMTPESPSLDQWQEIFLAVASAPDHGALMPFRFAVIDGEAKLAFDKFKNEYMIAKMPDRKEFIEQKVAAIDPKVAAYVISYTIINTQARISVQDQEYAAVAACSQFGLAVQAMGFATVWYSVAFEPQDLMDYLKIQIQEHQQLKFTGLFPVGSTAQEMTTKKRPIVDDFVRFY